MITTMPPTRTRSQTQTHLPLHFAIVGGGIAGLATAIALTRVGHRVTVFEQHPEDANLPSGGVRIPPNQSKILENWGLLDSFSRLAERSLSLNFYTYDQGEFIGRHTWDEAILRESGGRWMFARHSDFRNFLLSAARANGATVRFGVRVSTIDEDRPRITLSTGEVFPADIIVGAGGSNSPMRRALFNGHERVQDTGLVMFNMTIPVKKIRSDPSLVELLDKSPTSTWFGGLHSAIGFPLGPSGEYALQIYTPRPRGVHIPGYWDSPAVSSDLLTSSLGTADPRLRTLVSFASPPSCISVQAHQPLDDDDWLLPSSLGSVLGDSAHPSPPGIIQNSAMALEDAAVFAKLFSHLRRADQAPGFLRAYASLRASRAQDVIESEMANMNFITMPLSDPMAVARNEGMRELTRQGKNVLGDDVDVDGAEGSNAQWEMICSLWGYDAEDEADNWWVEWGVLGERSQEAPKALTFDFCSAIVGVETDVNVSK